MRTVMLAASTALALAAVAAPAFAAPVSPTVAAAVAADEITDAELGQYAQALAAVTPINAQVQGGSPTPEQQAAMVQAIAATGLEVERFNAISSAVAADAVVRARLAVVSAPASAPGSVAAGVTDAELDQYAAAMAAIRPISAGLNGAAPSDEQRAAMVQAITATGLEVERFNAITGAAQSDARLGARVALASARRGA